MLERMGESQPPLRHCQSPDDSSTGPTRRSPRPGTGATDARFGAPRDAPLLPTPYSLLSPHRLPASLPDDLGDLLVGAERRSHRVSHAGVRLRGLGSEPRHVDRGVLARRKHERLDNDLSSAGGDQPSETFRDGWLGEFHVGEFHQRFWRSHALDDTDELTHGHVRSGPSTPVIDDENRGRHRRGVVAGIARAPESASPSR